MKFSVIFTVAALVAKASAGCFTESLGYPCCTGQEVVFVDSNAKLGVKDGKWGVENGRWCGISSGDFAGDPNQNQNNNWQNQNQNNDWQNQQNQNNNWQNQGQNNDWQNQQNQNNNWQNQNQNNDWQNQQNQQQQNQGQNNDWQNQQNQQNQQQQNQGQNNDWQNQQNQQQQQNQGQNNDWQNQQNQQNQQQQNQGQNNDWQNQQNQQQQNQGQNNDWQNQQNQNQDQNQNQNQNNDWQNQQNQNQDQNQNQNQNNAPVTTTKTIPDANTPANTPADTTTTAKTIPDANTPANTPADTTTTTAKTIPDANTPADTPADTTTTAKTVPDANTPADTTADTTTGGNVAPSGEQYTHSGNPFAGHEFFINPYYTAEVDQAIANMSDSSLIAMAEKMKEYSNAIWLDTIKNMNDWLETNLKGALAQQSSSGKTVLTVFVVYDLPGRDCHALASNGELLANEADMERYKTDYIDVIESTLKTYNSQPVVLIIEPDSIANMVTNLESTPACAESQTYYMDGHAYLIQKLGVLKHVAMYLDIGHAFWLGWDDNREKAAKVYSEVIASGAPGEVRGFADNVANYTPWEDPELSRGPETEWNPCPDEKRYLEAISQDFKSAGIKSVYFVSDTSRNGKKTDRTHPGEWCNQTGAGVGARPQASPISGMEYLDAFYWVKPIGESDGTSDESAARYDGYCGHETAMKPAPEAGQWFQEFFEMGIKNANPPL